jgi:hypothetical protein
MNDEELFQNASGRAILMQRIWEQGEKDTVWVDLFTKEELETHGFIVLPTRWGIVDGKSYCCPRRRVLPFTPMRETDADPLIYQKIVNRIKALRMTHIFKVEGQFCKFWFGSKDYVLDNAMTVLVEGCRL